MKALKIKRSGQITALFLLFLIFACKETTKPPEKPITSDIHLTAETTAPTFTRLRIDITSAANYDFYELTRDDSVVFCDSILPDSITRITRFDGGLIPNSFYDYSALLYSAGRVSDTSAALTVMTADTTSHAIAWQVDTIGVFPSILRDVAAIDENTAWAVGDVELDKLSNEKANIVKWDGTQYQFEAIKVKLFDGQYGYQELMDIMVFDQNNIWMFSIAGSYLHWNGSEYESEFLWETKGIPKASWGAAPDNFFVVGDNGSITHYDGSGFTLMDSGTDVDLFDIDGVVDPHSGQIRAWAIGWESGISVVLYFDGNVWTNIWDMDNPLFDDNFRFPRAVYVPDDKNLILSVWNGHRARLYCFDQLNIFNHILLSEHTEYSFGMAGDDYTNIFIVSTFTGLEHFNGISIHRFNEVYGGDWFFGISRFGNRIYVVGETDQYGLFLRTIN